MKKNNFPKTTWVKVLTSSPTDLDIQKGNLFEVKRVKKVNTKRPRRLYAIVTSDTTIFARAETIPANVLHKNCRIYEATGPCDIDAIDRQQAWERIQQNQQTPSTELPRQSNAYLLPDTLWLNLSEPLDRNQDNRYETLSEFKRISMSTPILPGELYVIESLACSNEYFVCYGQNVPRNNTTIKAVGYHRQVYLFTGLMQQPVL